MAATDLMFSDFYSLIAVIAMAVPSTLIERIPDVVSQHDNDANGNWDNAG